MLDACERYQDRFLQTAKEYEPPGAVDKRVRAMESSIDGMRSSQRENVEEVLQQISVLFNRPRLTPRTVSIAAGVAFTVNATTRYVIRSKD